MNVIFDMDGVIADTEQLHLRAWQEFLAKHGVSHTPEEFRSLFGMANFQIFAKVLPKYPPSRYARLQEDKEAIYRKDAKGVLKEVPGASDLIRMLHERGAVLAIGSSGPLKNIMFNLRELGLERYFKAIVSSEDVMMGKPSPEIFLKAAARINAMPEDCIVIEDSLPGIEAGKRAGMKVIAITTTHPRERLAAADLVIGSFKDLTYEVMEASRQ